jgi:hypothetical protein
VNYAPGRATQSIVSPCEGSNANSQYVINAAAGSVVHTPTQRMWNRCVEGVSGSSCSTGAPLTPYWSDSFGLAAGSTNAGYNDWRVPTVVELQSLLSAGCSNPTINDTVFLAAPSNFSWTDQASGNTGATAVYFVDGITYPVGRNTTTAVLRSVRGAAGIDPLVTTAQTLNFGAPPQLVLYSSATVIATNSAGAASSGNPVRYTSLTPVKCSVNSGTGQVNGLAAGTCIIAADQYGRINAGVNYAPANQVTQSLAVLIPQGLIWLILPPLITVGGSGTARAIATGSGYGGSYTSLTPSVCSIDAGSGLITGLAFGTCTIQADQAGDASYAAASPITLSLTARLTQALSWCAPPALTVGGSGSLIATASSGLAPSYTSLTTLVCTVDADTGLIAALAAGTCTIQADQAGNATFAAAPSISQNLTVLLTQTLAWGALPSLAVGGNGSLIATASSTLAPSYASLTPTVCSVNSSSGLVSAITIGTCSIQAAQLGDATHAAAPSISQNLTVRLTQTLTWNAPSAYLVLGAPDTWAASATASSGLAPSYTSLTPLVCSVNSSSGLASAVTVGVCIIRVDQAGDGTFDPAPSITQNVPVLIPQTMSWVLLPTLVVGGSGTITATASSGLPVVHYRSRRASVCSVVDATGLVTAHTGGTCIIRAYHIGSQTVYAAAYIDQNLTVSKVNSVTTLVAHTPEPSSLGTAISIALTVAASPPLAAPVPTGTITVSDGTASCVITLPATTCSFNPSGMGSKTLVASYSGDASFNGSVSPGVSHSVTTGCALTVDGASAPQATTHGLLILRKLLGLPGDALTRGAITAGAFVSDPQVIADRINAMVANGMLDLDGDGHVYPHTDGLILLRAMFGLTGTAVTQGTGITASWATIRDALNARCGTGFLP